VPLVVTDDVGRAGFEEETDDVGIAGPRGQVQRRVVAEPRDRGEVRAGVHEDIGQRRIAALRRPVQRRHAVGLRRARVRALLEQRPHARQIATLRRIRDGRTDLRLRDERGREANGQEEAKRQPMSSHGSSRS
jgi:hypothetical protein